MNDGFDVGQVKRVPYKMQYIYMYNIGTPIHSTT